MIFLSVTFFLCCFYMLIRSEVVYHERRKMIDIVYSQDNWEHYRALMHAVGHHQMWLHFWVWPISKMWPDELQDLIVI